MFDWILNMPLIKTYSNLTINTHCYGQLAVAASLFTPWKAILPTKLLKLEINDGSLLKFNYLIDEETPGKSDFFTKLSKIKVKCLTFFPD